MLSDDFLHALNLADARGFSSVVDDADLELMRLAQAAPPPSAPLPLPPSADRVTRLEHAYNRLATIVNQLKKKLDELGQGTETPESSPPAEPAVSPQVEIVPGNVPEVNVTA